MESMMALKFIGAGLMAFGMLGAAIGVGNIFGSLLNPAFAGLAMAFSSVSVVSNSLRIKAKKL